MCVCVCVCVFACVCICFTPWQNISAAQHCVTCQPQKVMFFEEVPLSLVFQPDRVRDRGENFSMAIRKVSGYLNAENIQVLRESIIPSRTV